MSNVNVLKAMLKLQGAVTCVAKDGRADAGKKVYKYSTLPEVLDTIRQPMQDAGLVLHQTTATRHLDTAYQVIGEGTKWEGNSKVSTPTYGSICEVEVASKVYHAESGEMLDSTMSVLANGLDVQALGSAVSYLRRYTLMTLLGIASDDMADDGQAARGAQTGQPMPQQGPQQPRQAPQAPAASEGAAKKAALVTRVLELCEQTGTAKPRDLAVWDEAKLTAFGKGLREQLNKQQTRDDAGQEKPQQDRGFHDD